MSLLIVIKYEFQILAISDTIGAKYENEELKSIYIGNKFFNLNNKFLVGYSGVDQLAKKAINFIKKSFKLHYGDPLDLLNDFAPFVKGLNEGYNYGKNSDNKYYHLTGFVICGFHQNNPYIYVIEPDGIVKEAKKIALLGSVVEKIDSEFLKILTELDNYNDAIRLLNIEFYNRITDDLGKNKIIYNLLKTNSIRTLK